MADFEAGSSNMRLIDWVDLPDGNEEVLTKAIAFVGPICVGIDASQQSFQFYKSGNYKAAASSMHMPNHAVLAVGYGTEPSGLNFYRLRNSWGTSWGKFIKSIFK